MNGPNLWSLAKFWQSRPKFLCFCRSMLIYCLKSQYSELIRFCKCVLQNWSYWTKIIKKIILPFLSWKRFFQNEHNGRKFGITRVIIYVRAPYFENIIIFLNSTKIGDFAIFPKKVLISETVTDRAKRRKIWAHKGYNMLEHHTLKIL